MRLVLHVGPHKTGSTYIQQQFVKHKRHLAKNDWTYPDAGRPDDGQAGHHDLAHEFFSFFGADAIPTRRRALKKAAESNRHLVFSAEGMCRWTPGQFKRFHKFMGRERLEIVYYLRDPFDLFYSFWKEEIKQGRTPSLLEKFAEQFADPVRSRILNPAKELFRYKNIGMDADIKIVPYNYLAENKKDLFEVLVNDVLGVEGEFSATVDRPNAALSIEVTETLRLLEQHFDFTHQIDGKAVRFALYELRHTGEFEKIEAAFESGLNKMRKQIHLKRQCSLYSTINRQLKSQMADSIVAAGPDDELFSRKHVFLDYYEKYDLLSSDDFRHMFYELVEKLEPRLVPKKS